MAGRAPDARRAAVRRCAAAVIMLSPCMTATKRQSLSKGGTFWCFRVSVTPKVVVVVALAWRSITPTARAADALAMVVLVRVCPGGEGAGVAALGYGGGGGVLIRVTMTVRDDEGAHTVIRESVEEPITRFLPRF